MGDFAYPSNKTKGGENCYSKSKRGCLFRTASLIYLISIFFYTIPWASMAWATFRNPPILAPFT